jgi:hypothetical protein
MQQYYVNGRFVSAEEMARIRNAKKNNADFEGDATEEGKNPLECPYCGKVCKNQIGFNKHVEACKKKAL